MPTNRVPWHIPLPLSRLQNCSAKLALAAVVCCLASSKIRQNIAQERWPNMPALRSGNSILSFHACRLIAHVHDRPTSASTVCPDDFKPLSYSIYSLHSTRSSKSVSCLLQRQSATNASRSGFRHHPRIERQMSQRSGNPGSGENSPCKISLSFVPPCPLRFSLLDGVMKERGNVRETRGLQRRS